ncbi:SUKH-4 immunity protein [Bacillus sp. OV322]|uniref:SUKH-4 family immunity protein n=1 Tax=Bacillus sp. OV322 TaxID=1882764 RepID=UPI0008E15E6F|nr:SUKH-4 family immunity protein [Bacillus sp. OV322]SFB99344.1 SUKH-4 immunity protein [Bacillus sp. OV322]
MISPQDFLDDWNKDLYGLINYDEKIIKSFTLSQETKDFLIEAGFPESAPPFLTFESAVNGGGEKLIKRNNKLSKMYDKFIYFGFTGSGYPICIDESNSELVYIDYDNENKVVLINSTITKFAEALLVYVDFIKKVKAVNGRRAYLEKNATKDLLEWISGALQKIDAISLTEGAFWEEELSSFGE